ncbi:hypothetical protein AQUCO_05400057v1 [Aquilegia coerulea]|uniref:Epidermal patterning factor-like protein n=1 Tax=Aquilegia coerulea TaxID=218851 RepID=A0A2G5CIM1_AQUCA|nr:hypothetical protein AQUCO_05400057v1 [Aquilegia coerulea]
MDQSIRAMKISHFVGVILIALLLIPTIISARHIDRLHLYHNHHHHHKISRTKDGTTMKADFYGERRVMKNRRQDTVQVAGSRLPDCSHACGSCRPCRLVMVSFVCSSIEEAETCPMAYKCMCNRKSYPVP